MARQGRPVTITVPGLIEGGEEKEEMEEMEEEEMEEEEEEEKGKKKKEKGKKEKEEEKGKKREEEEEEEEEKGKVEDGVYGPRGTISLQYINRRFVDRMSLDSGAVVEDLIAHLGPDRPVLLSGEAGMGKTCYLDQLFREWGEGRILRD